MKVNNIKNKVAFKEVLNNSNYDVKINNSEISIEKRDQEFAFLTTDKENLQINVLGKNIIAEEAKKLLTEVKMAIEMIDYIEFMQK